MNKVYRSVWSAARQAYVVASENTRSKGKPSKASAAVGVAALALVGLSQPAVASCNVVAASTTACELDAGEDATISTAGSITINSSAGVGGAVTVLPTEAAGFITNDGTLDASDGKSGVLLETDSSASMLTNRGAISSTGGGGAGVTIGSGATLGTLDNGPGIAVFGGQGTVGHITSTGPNSVAISVSGTINNLNNTQLGVISSTADFLGAIQLSDSGHIGSLVNHGTIDAQGSNSSGILLNNSSSITTLTNHGTIRGGWYGINLSADAGITTLINRGIIEGCCSGAPYAIRETTGGSGGIGTIRIEGNNTAEFLGRVYAPSATAVLAENATFTMRRFGQFDVNLFQNDGRLIVATKAPAELPVTLTGDYTQSATGILQIDVTNDSTYSQLRVDGNITLPTDARFHVNVADPNFVFGVSELYNVISATFPNTLSWDGTHITTDNSVLFDFTPIIDSGDSRSIMLEIVAASSNGGGAGNAVSATGNRVAAGAAAVIDDLSAAFAGGGTGNAELDSFIGSLGALTTNAQLAAAVESTLPVLQGAAPRVNLNTQANMAQAIQGRQQATLGLSAGDAFVDQHLWIKPFGSWGDQKNRNGAQGYDSETYGVMVGVDAEVRPDYRLGVSLGYANSQADSNNGLNTMDVDSYLVSVYGSAQVTDATSVNWQAGYSHHNNEGSRRILVVDSVAKADYSSQGWHAGIGVDHAIALSESVTFIPSVTLDYDRIRDKAYRETGAGALNLSVDRNNTEQLILGVNSRLQFELTETSSLQADLGVGHDFNAKQNSITSAYVGGGNAFTTQGIEPSKSLWRAGLGYVNQTANGTEIGARADVQQRNSGQQDASASLTLRWAF